jgi:hypothetical protein
MAYVTAYVTHCPVCGRAIVFEKSTSGRMTVFDYRSPFRHDKTCRVPATTPPVSPYMQTTYLDDDTGSE